MKKLLLLLSVLSISLSVPAAVGPSNSASSIPRNVQTLDDKKSMRKQKKAMKKELRKELKKIRKSQKGTKNKALSITAVILLGVLVFAGYTLLLFILEYALGYTTLFFLLWFLGLAAIIYGLVKMIKKIKRKKATG